VTEEVEVRRASTKLVADPEDDETGSINKAVPMRIRTVKANEMDWVAESFESIFIRESVYIHLCLGRLGLLLTEIA
jgi:hypothetical protein